jgi:Cu+-exporting ATPase
MGTVGIDYAQAEAAMLRLETEGKTAILVARGGVLAGVVAVADTLQPEAAQAVAECRRERVEVVMLTSDNQSTTRWGCRSRRWGCSIRSSPQQPWR